MLKSSLPKLYRRHHELVDRHYTDVITNWLTVIIPSSSRIGWTSLYRRHHELVDCHYAVVITNWLTVFKRQCIFSLLRIFYLPLSPTWLLLRLTICNTVGVLGEIGPAYPSRTFRFTPGYLVEFVLLIFLVFCVVFFVCFSSFCVIFGMLLILIVSSVFSNV